MLCQRHNLQHKVMEQTQVSHYAKTIKSGVFCIIGSHILLVALDTFPSSCPLINVIYGFEKKIKVIKVLPCSN